MLHNLVERLRDDLPGKLVEKHWVTDFDAVEATYAEAADTIEALRSEVTDLQNTIARLTREIGKARDAEAALLPCDLCAGECRGHSIGGDWTPEPGSRAYVPPAPEAVGQ